MLKHFTATALIIHDKKVLLLFHKKLKSWLPPGGHMEENELPHECAIRETKEETGVDIEILSSRQGNLIHDSIAWELPCPIASFSWEIPRPYCMLEEVIPQYQQHAEHRHIDHVFLAKPLSFHLVGDDEMKWFSLEEIRALPDEVIFANCRELCVEALQQRKNP